MSGAETLAGLVLAVPPLLIAFLEHERECVRVFNLWRKYRVKFREMETRIHGTVASFDLMLHKLYLPIVDNLEDLDALKSQAEIPSRTSALYNVRLQRRLLPRVRPIFLEATEDLRNAIEQLESDLEKFRTQKPTKPASNTKGMPSHSNVGESAKHEWKRLGFAMHEKPLRECLGQVTAQLDKLQNLLDRNDEVLGEGEKFLKRVNKGSESAIIQFWRHAADIWQQLFESWHCKCRPRHLADLVLDYRTPSDVRLDVVLRYSPEAQAVPPRNDKWSLTHALIQESHPSQSPKQNCDLATRRARDANLQTSEQPKQLGLCVMLMSSTTSTLVLMQCPGQETLYSVSRVEDTTLLQMATKCYSLAEALQHVDGIHLSRVWRLHIASCVASAHLQFYASGWLGKGWDKHMILFPATWRGVNFERPLLRRDFDTEEIDSNGWRNRSGEYFLRLGILLLELCFGQPFESSPFVGQYRNADDQIDAANSRMAAENWADLVEGEIGTDYAAAISWCLRQNWVKTEDKTWRRELFQQVVLPLRKAY